jgi:hypothetical protein
LAVNSASISTKTMPNLLLFYQLKNLLLLVIQKLYL